MDATTGETVRLDAADERQHMRRERRRERRNNSIAGGVFLLGLGMLMLTGWWWPGIMLVIGLAAAAELMRRGQTSAAMTTFLGFAALPVAIALLSAIHVPWLPVGAFVLIALGLVSLARTA
ncbi:MAG TPA: hypothetical protein VFT66_21345 [Roseiflexaceae bacterium]|jgi:hypothetical protein|nr:hypothetical protein [Roseiflexaceae bacterium]